MDSPQNQPFVTLPIESTTALKNLRVCFCIDNSGSTGSKYGSNIVYLFGPSTNDSTPSVLDIEKAFTNKMRSDWITKPTFIAWNSAAVDVESVEQITSGGGTAPSTIFEGPTLITITNSDVLVLITDGQIGSGEIRHFGETMTKCGTHLKAIIGVIVGKRSASPADANVSVLVPTMISNGCILGTDAEESAVMWSCSAFKSAWNPTEIVEDTTWDLVSKINPAAICNLEIPSVNKAQEENLRSGGYIPMGSGLFFHPNHLLQSEPTWDDLVTLPFDRICQYFKVTNRCNELVTWFKKLNDKFVTEFTAANPEEKDNVNRLIQEIEQGRRPRRDANVLTSYRSTRNRALVRQHMNDEHIDDLLDDPRLVTLMQFFRNMMQIMREDEVMQHDAGTYTTSSMAPSRYTSMKKASDPTTKLTGSTTAPLTKITAKFNEPFKWFCQFNKLYVNHRTPTSAPVEATASNAQPKVECSICYESSTPFILIRKHFDTNNLENLMTSPSSYFYPQILCAKCAGYFCNQQIDPVRVRCYGAVPLVTLVADSKKYFLEGFAAMTNVMYIAPTESITTNPFEIFTGFISGISSLFAQSMGSGLDQAEAPQEQVMHVLSLFCVAVKSFYLDDNQMITVMDNFRSQF